MFDLAILLLTYAPAGKIHSYLDIPETELAQTALISTLTNLQSAGSIYVQIADDGSDGEHVWKLVHLLEFMGIKFGISDSERAGYGRNYNLGRTAIREVGARFVLPLESDWLLMRPLDLTPFMAVMDAGLFGCLRLGYIGFTQQLMAEFVGAEDHLWLRFLPESPEPHIFAGHPRIETAAWGEALGPWPEGLSPGETEFAVAHRKESRDRVGWPISLVAVNGDAFQTPAIHGDVVSKWRKQAE